jgi:hypothetical protein
MSKIMPKLFHHSEHKVIPINKNPNWVVLLEAMLFKKRDIQKLQLRLLKAYTYIQAFRRQGQKEG